jgi:dTDP-4-amino-4,6-dideoxygalactose transaminase
MLGGAALKGMIGSQYRMSEFTGGVLLAQIRKLDTIIGALRGHARTVFEGLAGVPDLHLRRRPDPDGDICTGIWLEFPSGAQRDKFLTAMRAENVPATAPSAVALVPLHPSVEQKLTTHPKWPSFVSERGRSIRYGAECCPRTTAIQHRFAGIALDPKYARRDIDDIVAAIRKVLSSVARG